MSILNNMRLKKVQLKFQSCTKRSKSRKQFLMKDHLKKLQLNTLILESIPILLYSINCD